ncbi:hypothetical protein ABZU76_41215 [Amycolatopsis sp. NPDC005232]|uniref:hypothetical protein n=1 Tax=Amycolatopsis sp. NPDC005232 TaxID=3157027 RepID=UPI0033BC4312
MVVGGLWAGPGREVQLIAQSVVLVAVVLARELVPVFVRRLRRSGPALPAAV